jgi:hypothetical protein
VPYLEVVSSISSQNGKLYVMVINKNFDQPITANFTIQGFTPVGNASVVVLDGAGIDANTGTAPVPLPGVVWAPQATDSNNPQFNLGDQTAVRLLCRSANNVGTQFSYQFSPHSITSLVLSSGNQVSAGVRCASYH